MSSSSIGLWFVSTLTAVASLLCLYLYWLKQRQPWHGFAKVYDTVRTWMFILVVLSVTYLLGAWAMAVVLLLVVGKSVQEIYQLWQPYPDASTPPSDHCLSQPSQQSLSQKPSQLSNQSIVSVQPNPTQSSIADKRMQPLPIDFALLLLLLVFAVSLVCLYQQLSQDKQTDVLLYVLFVVQFGDVAQYLMGKRFGQRWFSRKLAVRISPNKTIEGAIFGIAVVMGLGVLLGQLLTPYDTWTLIWVAALLGILGLAGDLSVSLLKRQHKVKDMGACLPGHGGVLDRIDSLLLSVPVFTLLYFLGVL